MQKRVNLPGADALFGKGGQAQLPNGDTSEAERAKTTSRHDEKITIYLSSADLLAIEQARLQLKAEHGIKVDRGRLVREATAMILEEFSAQGAQSGLVRRLS